MAEKQKYVYVLAVTSCASSESHGATLHAFESKAAADKEEERLNELEGPALEYYVYSLPFTPITSTNRIRVTVQTFL